MVSENSDSGFISRCLQLGADDYIKKPYDTEELGARLTVAINRHQRVIKLLGMSDGRDKDSPELANADSIPTDASRYKHAGDVRLCDVKREVAVMEQLIKLTRTEYQLLKYLFDRIDRPCSSVELLQNVLGYSDENYLPSLHSHVSRLRRKLKASETTAIETIWCYGYRISKA